MKYRIEQVEVLRYPVMKVTFDDGLAGEYDLSDWIATDRIAQVLKDPLRFAQVEIGPEGRSFGWNLGEAGHEIDFCSDAVRIKIETDLVERMASDYAASRTAAE